MAVFRFLYQPVSDLDVASRFYTKGLGFVEAWRDGDLSAGLQMPGAECQMMLSKSGKPAGPMYLVENLDQWITEHPDAEVVVERDAAGSGEVVGFKDPDGNVFYIFDQPPG